MIKSVRNALPYHHVRNVPERIIVQCAYRISSRTMVFVKYVISSFPNVKIVHLLYNAKPVLRASTSMMIIDALLAPSLITVSPALQPHPVQPAKITMVLTSIKSANFALNLSAVANFASPPINAHYANLINTILSTISAENVQINSRTAKLVRLMHVTNAPILRLLTTDNVLHAEISALDVLFARKEMYVSIVFQMLFIFRQQYAISVSIHCSTAKHVRIKHSV